MDEIASTCQAVGFNTIPAWLRPYDVLSTGERFRVELARRMIEAPTDRPLLVDEFSSVVDRQVAKIGAHAVQKWVRSQRAPVRRRLVSLRHRRVASSRLGARTRDDELPLGVSSTTTRRSLLDRARSLMKRGRSSLRSTI
jgi:hypothetical protein